MGMADNLGFGGLAHVTKARPIIQAVSAALLEVPEQARLKLANAQFGTHRCSGSPSEFPLLCCFTNFVLGSVHKRLLRQIFQYLGSLLRTQQETGRTAYFCANESNSEEFGQEQCRHILFALYDPPEA
jgi:hypothetical protein